MDDDAAAGMNHQTFLMKAFKAIQWIALISFMPFSFYIGFEAGGLLGVFFAIFFLIIGLTIFLVMRNQPSLNFEGASSTDTFVFVFSLTAAIVGMIFALVFLKVYIGLFIFFSALACFLWLERRFS